MHPAASIIFFTTASGLGYGMLAWAGLLAALGVLPPERWFGVGLLGTALALVSAGLLSSLLHLGHPERAWRALSQWKSSWLSREGVMAILTFVPAGVFALGWVIFGASGGAWIVAGLLTVAGALLTVYCTAMIYRSLAPIRQWSNSTTVPVYLALALMTGAVWVHAFVHAFGVGGTRTPLVTGAIAILTVPVAFSLKHRAWTRDHDAGGPTALSAAGLTGAALRSVEWPHTAENYLLKEMGYRVARKHAARLRTVAIGSGFVAPLVLLVLTVGRTGAAPTTAAIVAALLAAAGTVVERWLFFAEAKHTVTLYYGR
jgi:DMSO reductase anchor subunit